jgi:hypothetical protein
MSSTESGLRSNPEALFSWVYRKERRAFAIQNLLTCRCP